MQAIRLHPSPKDAPPYSPTNPAPPSALHLDTNIPIPKPSTPGTLLIRIQATTVIRDALTWPETYAHEYTIPGHDFSGTVVEVFPGAESRFKPGDEVFGMAHADRGAAWAEYAVVKDEEVALKPAGLGWEEAAALPLSGLTGFEALFEKAGLDVPVLETGGGLNPHSKKVLITGAAGGVGVYLVQLAAIAGLHVVAATSSNARNEEFLRELGADETVEYGELVTGQDCRFDVIVDTVGGNVLAECWGFVKDDGVLVSVDSASFDFVRVHGERGIRKEGVRALFFIVEPSRPALEALARFAEMGRLRSFVLDTYPLAKAEEAYERASGRVSGRGKIVLVV